MTESVYYATLNHTTPRLARLFSHTISQRCVRPDAAAPFACQPHYDTQPNSSKNILLKRFEAAGQYSA